MQSHSCRVASSEVNESCLIVFTHTVTSRLPRVRRSGHPATSVGHHTQEGPLGAVFRWNFIIFLVYIDHTHLDVFLLRFVQRRVSLRLRSLDNSHLSVRVPVCSLHTTVLHIDICSTTNFSLTKNHLFHTTRNKQFRQDPW
jgi:hypothetical protein